MAGRASGPAAVRAGAGAARTSMRPICTWTVVRRRALLPRRRFSGTRLISRPGRRRLRRRTLRIPRGLDGPRAERVRTGSDRTSSARLSPAAAGAAAGRSLGAASARDQLGHSGPEGPSARGTEYAHPAKAGRGLSSLGPRASRMAQHQWAAPPMSPGPRVGSAWRNPIRTPDDGRGQGVARGVADALDRRSAARAGSRDPNPRSAVPESSGNSSLPSVPHPCTISTYPCRRAAVSARMSASRQP